MGSPFNNANVNKLQYQQKVMIEMRTIHIGNIRCSCISTQLGRVRGGGPFGGKEGTNVACACARLQRVLILNSNQPPPPFPKSCIPHAMLFNTSNASLPLPFVILLTPPLPQHISPPQKFTIMVHTQYSITRCWDSYTCPYHYNADALPVFYFDPITHVKSLYV